MGKTKGKRKLNKTGEKEFEMNKEPHTLSLSACDFSCL